MDNLLRVHKEKVLGVVISDKLTWDLHLHLITAKANKLLGLLKRSCPMLTKVAVSKSIIIKQLWNPTFVTLQKSRVSRSEVTKTWGWTSSEACHQMDFKFDDWHCLPCLTIEKSRISFSFTHVQPVLLYIDVDITYYVTFNNHPRRRCGRPTELYWLLLLLSRPVRLALFKLYPLFVL